MSAWDKPDYRMKDPHKDNTSYFATEYKLLPTEVHIKLSSSFSYQVVIDICSLFEKLLDDHYIMHYIATLKFGPVSSINMGGYLFVYYIFSGDLNAVHQDSRWRTV